tara:strand:- start:4904 stop:5119 length:216 start_codon:yes stop_codon:yes gene_type:complete
MSAKLTLKNAISSVGVVLPKYGNISSMPGDADDGTLVYNTDDGFIYVWAPKNVNDMTDKEWKKVPATWSTP